MIGKLQRVPLREVWKHEALDFTKWLEDNPDVLSEALGKTLSNVEREKAAGSFSVDLVAEDESGSPVIIENQLEKSDHDHLGKLLTYLAAIEAKTAVWIVSEPRPEHVKAVAWLNDSSSANFFLLKVEAVRIGESPAAPLLTLIVGPSAESQGIRENKVELALRQVWRKEFWSQLLELVKTKTKLHANITPGTETWIGTGAGKSGLGFSYVVRMHNANIELYIDRGDEQVNRTIFDNFLANKDAIEAEFGHPLDWQTLEGKRAFRIAYFIEQGGLHDQDDWPQIQEAMVDAMIQFEKAVRPFINSLQI